MLPDDARERLMAVTLGHRAHYRFPWRDGNRAELLVDGKEFYGRMLEAIARARLEVLLEMYLFESGAVADRFVEAFAGAAQRGVLVRLLIDDFGARRLRRADRARLLEAGAQLVFYNRLRLGKWLVNLARDHRKLLVVDGEVVFVGGAGITDEFDPPHGRALPWHEVMVAVEGPVAADWRRVFGATWVRAGGERAGLLLPAPAAIAGGVAGRVTVSRRPQEAETVRALIKRVRSAERRVWIMVAYFVPSWRFKRALKSAARAGVDVRLLLPGPVSDHPGVRHAGRRFYARLLAGGVRIYEYQPRFLHAKCALCDDWVSVGSSNFDRWNLRWNLEANQEIEDSRFAASAQALFEADFPDAVEILHGEWLARPWRARLRERFWGRVDRLLHRIGRGRREDDL